MAIGKTNAGGASLGFWKFILATAQPATVTRSTFVAIVTDADKTIYAQEAQPATPEADAVWFHLQEPADNVLHSTGDVQFRCWGVYQYSSGSWVAVNAYYSFMGVWKQVTALPPSGTTLANCSWDQIGRIAAVGKATDYFCVGDEKEITLSTSEVVTLQIIGFGHDDLAAAGGGKAPITFGFKNCLNTAQQMNTTNTTTGGYAATPLYAAINGAIYGSLPAELRNVMKNVNKYTTAGSNLNTIVTTQENIFLLSAVEVHGSGGNAVGEGTQYAFFTSGGARVKQANGVNAAWWLRSPYGTGRFCKTLTTGAYSGDGYLTESNGVALALCV